MKRFNVLTTITQERFFQGIEAQDEEEALQEVRAILNVDPLAGVPSEVLLGDILVEEELALGEDLEEEEENLGEMTQMKFHARKVSN